MITRFISTRFPRFSRPHTRDYETPVQSGLAVTPAQMLDLTARGIPISPANLGLQYDSGYSDLDFNTPLEYTRGVDIGQLWEERENAKQRIKLGLKKHAEMLAGKE